MMFFHCLKIIFEISASKRSTIHKKINFSQKQIKFLKPCFQTELKLGWLNEALHKDRICSIERGGIE